MFFLKKLLQALILPPGLFALLFAVWGIASWRRGHRRGSWLLFATALGVWAISTGAGSGILVELVESNTLPLEQAPQADVLVVMGGGIIDGAPGRPADPGIPSAESTCRLLEAWRLYRKSPRPVIISGGRINTKVSEAEVDARLLEELGVPVKHLILETASRDTVENARFIRKIIKEKGFRQPLIITSAFHVRRTALINQGEGFAAVYWPCQPLIGNSDRTGIHAFLPNASYLRYSVMSAKEMGGLLVYGIRYGFWPGHPVPVAWPVERK